MKMPAGAFFEESDDEREREREQERGSRVGELHRLRRVRPGLRELLNNTNIRSKTQERQRQEEPTNLSSFGLKLPMH
jgi:hypothetical protein